MPCAQVTSKQQCVPIEERQRGFDCHLNTLKVSPHHCPLACLIGFTGSQHWAGTIPLTGEKGAKALQVAHLNHFLLSEKADHITGTEMYIDGAESLFGP
jgi:hypothetical protein